ncbi:protein arginine kinase [Tissierella sp. Yu-01]|uniref:protein arginine kinase n=1 Tax=Tissierella sp. Yu-01 TaxID=3035694 RepID=UPI00240D89A0|nr:protein arginine kinase [Tissierella sp. Yu-01]WFA07689.1 protein arginine kinase [Tissierella sp. Yu-01]
MTRWLEGSLVEQDVAISSRIRVARNIKDYVFPLYMSIEDSDKLTNDVLLTVKEEFQDSNFRFYRISDLSQKERLMFIEEHLISPGLTQKIDKSSFLVRKDERATIMINEEDHLRIQTLLPGLNLAEAWQLCSEIDDKLESKLNFAYDYELGYLTACPTNVGTGLRASVMLHLPCVTMTGNINALIESLRKVGLTVRGIYGEGTDAVGNLYQISNQTTLGDTEEELINKLNKIIYQVVTRERNTRKYLKEKKGIELEDKVYRSYGILMNSRLMSSKEAMKHLSNVKLAYDMGYITDHRLKDIFKLMVDIKPATIQMNTNKDLSKQERDNIRAKIIREYLLDMEG